MTRSTLIEEIADYLSVKRAKLEAQRKDLQHALESEDKCSVGDKHNTGRAKIQLEQEKLSSSWENMNQELELFSKAKSTTPTPNISFGNFIETDKNILFLGIGLGQIPSTQSKKIVFGLSVQSPLGKLLLGKTQADKVEINGMSYTIEKVF